MTYRKLYLYAKKSLSEAGIDSPGNDASLLVGHFFGLNRTCLALKAEETPSSQEESVFLTALSQRVNRRPLQYILGSWEFMGLSLRVGEGVLCPREDTAVLVKALAEALKENPLCGTAGFSPRGVDLCAGTGAVGLGLCSLLPEAEAVCLELSREAFPYLEENLSAYPEYKLRALRGNVLLPQTAEAFKRESLDFIVSNPPYIPLGQISDLQPEVQKEPTMALDGGEDGLLFYRAIGEHWIPLLKPGGVLAVEIGEEQGQAVSGLFEAAGLYDIRIKEDWAGLDRVVLGRRP